METDDFIARYPSLYHMAEAGAWPSIERLGLLSTTALLDRFEVHGPDREAIESAKRMRIITITHPVHGAAAIRDNLPLKESFLASRLVGVTPREWYELLNRKVFFWVAKERLETLLSARPYRKRAHDVLTLDTRELLGAHLPAVSVAPFNTGAMLFPSAPPRGRETFSTIAAYRDPAAARGRGRGKPVVELTVDYAVSDVARFVTRVERRTHDQAPEIVWSRT
jgi:hypothetical protein